jgi:CRP-like cAMP-binding protein
MSTSLYSINTYQKGSYIILEGEKKAGNFFIIKEGKVNISRKNPVIGEKQSEVMGAGDFFGVVGAMSQLPQMESAYALTKVVTITVNYKRFPELVQHNPVMVTKIIRSFSRKLRQFSQRDLESNDTQISESENFKILFRTALTYYQLNRKRIATYMFRAYLHYYPNGLEAEEARENLMKLEANSNFEKKTGGVQKFDDGGIIFCENEPTKEVYILKEGKVKITRIVDKKEVQLFIMKPGDIFGEMSILENKTRSATAIAIEDCELVVIKKENFELMAKKEPQLTSRLISLLAERIWNANKLILNSYLPDLDTKILDMLLILYERSKTVISDFQTFNFNITFTDVIGMIGLEERIDKLESNFLLAHKLIKLDQNSLVCTNIPALERQVKARRAKIDTMED